MISFCYLSFSVDNRRFILEHFFVGGLIVPLAALRILLMTFFSLSRIHSVYEPIIGQFCPPFLLIMKVTISCTFAMVKHWNANLCFHFFLCYIWACATQLSLTLNLLKTELTSTVKNKICLPPHMSHGNMWVRITPQVRFCFYYLSCPGTSQLAWERHFF